jgi:proline dehydrogenase
MNFPRFFLDFSSIFPSTFQLQMSEVIQKTRQYMMDIAGGTGNVLTHHKTIKDMEQYFSSMGDNKDVKKFLKQMTTDKEG